MTFVLKESNPDSELDINDTIDFKDDSSILEISPSSVQVSTLQNFSVSLYATNAGKTTVIASTTSKQIEYEAEKNISKFSSANFNTF